MKQYSRLQALALACVCSSSLYRDVGRNWRGIGLLYLLFLLALTWLPVALLVQVKARNYMSTEFPKFAQQVPPVTVKDGVVSSPVKQPYTIHDPATSQPMIILDTTGEITSLDNTVASALITRNKVMVRNQREIRTNDLSQVKYFYVDQPTLHGWADRLVPWVVPIGYVIVLAASLTWKHLVILIYGAIGLAFSRGFRANLTLAATMRLAAVAITPIVLLDTVWWVTDVSIPYWWFISLAAGITLTAVAIWPHRDSTPPWAPPGYLPSPYVPPVPPGGYPPPPPRPYL